VALATHAWLLCGLAFEPAVVLARSLSSGVAAHGWPMEPMIFQEYLEQVERLVQEGERNVARQRQVVDALDRDGHNTGEAMMLLRQLEDLLAMWIADRDRLHREQGL
jgi:hypothetical protein